MSNFKRLGAGLCAAVSMAVIAGCASTNSVPSAQVRAIVAGTNVGTAAVAANNALAFGLMQTTSPASAYLYIQTSSQSTFSYGLATANLGTLTNVPSDPNITTVLPTNIPPLISAPITLTPGTQYTAFLIGRPDVVAAVGTAQDPRALQTVVYSDTRTTPATSNVNLRVLNAAPDAGGNVDVLLDGVVAVGNIAYNNAPVFQTVASGVHTIQVKITGGGAVIVPSQPITFNNQKSETIIVTEPTAPTTASPSTALTFGLNTTED